MLCRVTCCADNPHLLSERKPIRLSGNQGLYSLFLLKTYGKSLLKTPYLKMNRLSGKIAPLLCEP